jgi:hypothetical protein
MRHPMNGTLYGKTEDGSVLVGEHGDEGVFDGDGRWMSGLRRLADPQMCRWVADGRPQLLSPDD